MASFLKRLEGLLAGARERGILDESASASLVKLAGEQDRERHFVSLTGILGWLGGGVAVLGIILLIAANWGSIPGLVKIGGFLVLFAAAHAAGLYMRWKEKPYPRTAEALHFMGAGLFLAGVGLNAQVYNLHTKPADGLLLWLVAIVPLAALLRSAPITVMSIFALLLWAHNEGAYPGSPLQLADTFSSHLMLEAGVGIALIGFGARLKKRDPAVSAVMRVSGVLLLIFVVYMLGFFRHWSYVPHVAWAYSVQMMTSVSVIYMPYAALALGILGVALGWRQLVSTSGMLRNLLGVMLVLVLLVAAGAAAADLEFIPRGPEMKFWDFGWEEKYDVAEWSLTVGAWVLWFGLSLWCLGYGVLAQSKVFINLGVVGVGLGVVTRFFDLARTLAQTGWAFLIGGLVLVATGWAMERWRRWLLTRMEARE